MKKLAYIIFSIVLLIGCSTSAPVNSGNNSGVGGSPKVYSEEYFMSPKAKTVAAEYFIGQSKEANQLIIKARLESFSKDKLYRVIVKSNGRNQTCFSESETLECSLDIFEAFGVQPRIDEETIFSFTYYDSASNIVRASELTVNYRQYFKFIKIQRDNVSTFSTPSPSSRTKITLGLNSVYPLYSPKDSQSFAAIYKDGLILWVPKSLVKSLERSLTELDVNNARRYALEAFEIYKKEGISGLRQRVIGCYSRKTKNDVDCVIWDITGYIVDKNFSETMRGPREEYFKDHLFRARINSSSHMNEFNSSIRDQVLDTYRTQVVRSIMQK